MIESLTNFVCSIWLIIYLTSLSLLYGFCSIAFWLLIAFLNLVDMILELPSNIWSKITTRK